MGWSHSSMTVAAIQIREAATTGAARVARRIFSKIVMVRDAGEFAADFS